MQAVNRRNCRKLEMLRCDRPLFAALLEHDKVHAPGGIQRRTCGLSLFAWWLGFEPVTRVRCDI